MKKMTISQGRSQDFMEGGTDMGMQSTHAKIRPCLLMKWKGRSSNYHRERVLNIASELESRFSTESWDKISFWLSSKLFL